MTSPRMRLGFLFNHDQVHQVAHSLPVALALARSGAPIDIVVATTNPQLTEEVLRLGGSAIGTSIELVRLNLRSPARRMLAAAVKLIAPADKLLIYKDNIDFFRSLDVLVVTEKTSLCLKTRYGLDKLRIVHTRHGAGDRAIGFDKASALFDLVLVSGTKIRDRLVADAGVDPGRISVVGYPKFDVIDTSAAADLPCDDGRPVVLYNPHPSPHLSSWYRMGRQVLDWFAAQDHYKLIFAPHVMLFERPFVISIDRLRIDRPGHIDERYLRAPNIHFDLGSRALTTMAYTNRADIYLGDVSSQVYEFLRKPRPCIFLNSHHIDAAGDPNFAHWQAGEVITDVDQLGEALRRAPTLHAAHYAAIQKRMFDETFDLTDEPSSLRAARAIAKLMGVALSAQSQDGLRAYG